MAGAVNGTTHGLDVQDSMFRVHRTLKRPFLPFLQVTHQTIPGTMAGGLEHLFVIGGKGRLQQEHLN